LQYLLEFRDVPFRYNGDPPASDLLWLQYDALALSHQRGEEWIAWQSEVIPELLKHQRPDGSFAPQDGQPDESRLDDAIRRSALACLILQTPWRYNHPN
jgi:hypothetical protein